MKIFILLCCTFHLFSIPPTHDIWNELLARHVNEKGEVNYKGFLCDTSLLNTYLQTLSDNPPINTWSEQEIKTFWINAYNAFTIQLVLQHYPVKSIKNIGGFIPFVNSCWDIKFIRIGNETLDLNNIEHSKLRKVYKDPRIHSALVCASKSCPKLLNEAYFANKLDAQLDDQCKQFLLDPFRNQVSQEISRISKIFSWYSSDFKIVGGVREFINKYSTIKINKKTRIKYLDYHWELNDTQ